MGVCVCVRVGGQEKRLKKMEGLARRNARAGEKGGQAAGGGLVQDDMLADEVKAFKAGLLDACPRCGFRLVIRRPVFRARPHLMPCWCRSCPVCWCRSSTHVVVVRSSCAVLVRQTHTRRCALLVRFSLVPHTRTLHTHVVQTRCTHVLSDWVVCRLAHCLPH